MDTIKAIALDYGSTISADVIDHVLGQKPVDSEAAIALRRLHRSGKRLVLASNTMPAETRWPALQAAGIADLFTAALLSYPLGVAKPEPLFYRLVIAAADCPAQEVLFVGDHLMKDVVAPIRHGMRAVLVRTGGVRSGEELPEGALLIDHVRDLPQLLGTK
ncbi:HAD family hydrolase [Spongiactinospora sp. TRM90649]|uniref:HAD family hydrolase n=1 Tax=Spongiactinospora sp. TRM90649 TaxID=3031114 RepID=UPI0023F95249|nr:HAD family hydrolase [Spongiactinospora sp. TRM90649]MDF5758412.1 HAD family hydrolase [Spongiactinospora sp. TRM90649]